MFEPGRAMGGCKNDDSMQCVFNGSLFLENSDDSPDTKYAIDFVPVGTRQANNILLVLHANHNLKNGCGQKHNEQQSIN